MASLFHYDNPEATGLALDSFAKGVVSMSSLVLGPALLLLASNAAGCTEEDTCEATIYGFRPSSLLSNVAILSGILSTISLPLFGAIVDHTPYRRHVGIWTALGLVVIKGAEIAVGPSTWFLVAGLQIVSGIVYNFHTTATYAYTSELTDDFVQMTNYNTSFYSIIFAADLVFLILVISSATYVGADDILTARISQTICASLSALFFVPAWTRIPDRPAKRHERDLFRAGFRKVQSTAVMIHQKYPDLQNLILAIMFGEAGTSALITISTTYMTQILKMTSTEISSIFFIVLLSGIPGAKLGGWVARQLPSHNVIHSAILCNLLVIITTTIASCTLEGPQHKHYTLIFAVFWGVGLGWQVSVLSSKHTPIGSFFTLQSPMHSTAFISMIPKGSEAELMGTYIFAGALLSWLPPLVFTALNEMGVPMAIGMWSITVFLIIAVYFLRKVDYHKAVHHVNSEYMEVMGEVIGPEVTILQEMV